MESDAAAPHDRRAIMSAMLILFDIDGTLLRSQGAGVKAMTQAGRTLLGDHFSLEGVEVAGRLDPLIWHDAAIAHGVADPGSMHDAFRSAYGKVLDANLQRDRNVIALPGVEEIIAQLRAKPDVTLGLLTGNYPETGRLKILAAGLDPDVFTITAWGCDGGHRRDLTAAARAIYEETNGCAIEPSRTIIIGDTPHDVDCAHHHGCRCIAVATGQHARAELESAGADLVVDTLADTDALLEWMLDGHPNRVTAR